MGRLVNHIKITVQTKEKGNFSSDKTLLDFIYSI